MILEALERLGGEAHQRDIAAACNLSTNGVAQTLGGPTFWNKLVVSKGDGVWAVKR
jgi:hypothetical protein